MAKEQILRARKHPGSNSLDLTVPSKICTNYDIQPGDVFEVDAVLDRSEVKLTYKRVYKKR
jgi:hypothetical protein